MAYLLALTICLWATALAEQVVVKVNGMNNEALCPYSCGLLRVSLLRSQCIEI